MNLNAKFAIARYNTTYIVYRHLYAILQILHMFSKKEEVKSIGNPAGIGKGTGFGLRERDRDGIGLGHYRLRATKKPSKYYGRLTKMLQALEDM